MWYATERVQSLREHWKHECAAWRWRVRGQSQATQSGRSPSCLRQAIRGWLILLPCLLFAGCGGGGNSIVSNPAPTPPDFLLVVSPQELVLSPGGSQLLSVSAAPQNGFSGSVQIVISGVPSEIAASTTSFTLSSDGEQNVTFSSQSTAVFVSAALTVQATSGNLSHSADVPLVVQVQSSAAHAPIRTRYLRTDSFYDPNSLQYAPPHFTAYDRVHRRFFVSNPFLNRIDVFDAASEVEMGTISVPGAWGIDVSPDGTKLYAGTLIGDLYLADPGAMQVTNIYPAQGIGPGGYAATGAFVLADGRLALLGGGFGGVDGQTSFAIWDPVTNSLTVIGAPIQNIGAFALSGDRTKVLLASIGENGPLSSYDPSTNQTATTSFAGFLKEIISTPDGKRFFAIEGETVGVYDAATVQQLGSFQGPVSGISSAAMSTDGTTLFVVDISSDLVAYDTTSFQEKGWVPNYQISDVQQTIVPGAVDETGLIVGPIGHGVAFADGSQIQPGTLSPQIGLGFPTPDAGPVKGGTAIQVTTSSGVQNISTFPGLTQAYAGNSQLVNVSYQSTQGNSPTIAGTTPGANASGVVDFTAIFSNNNVGIMPESFSYGPTIVEVVSNAATAEGGATGALIGYGLGQQTSDVQVQVGGTPATVTAVFSTVPYEPYPFPVEALEFVVPPGTPGTAVDITVTNADGSVTAGKSFYYASATTQFPLPNAVLQAGIYDSHRNVYYFADQSKIQVLSPTQGWQSPITLPNTGTTTQLLALSLLPDGSKLAVSDFGDKVIYVLNPDSPASAQAWALPQQGNDSGMRPTGLAILDNGLVYFGTSGGATGGGEWAFHKLDTSTGVFTDFTQLLESDQEDDFIRVLSSPDQSRVYSCIEGLPFFMDTSTDQQTIEYGIAGLSGSLPELAMSGDGSTLVTNGFFADANLNAIGLVAYTDRETFLPVATVGQKLNKDGVLMFQPLGDGIDVMGVATGRLVYRVELPAQLASVYDNLVMDGTDDTVAAITTNGVALIDLDSLALPNAASLAHRKIRASTARSRLRATAPGKRGLFVHGPHLRYSTTTFQ